VYTYEDLSDLAHAKKDRRSHLVRRIRGWLRLDRSPRLTIGLLLLPTAAFVVAVDFVLDRGGFDLTPMRWAIAVLAAWPIFVLLLRWRAAAEMRYLHLERLDLSYERYDDGAEAALNAPSEKQMKRNESIWIGVRSGLNQGMSRVADAGLPVMLLLGAVTLGAWTIWKLIGSGPSLLTDIIIDGEVVPATPSLATRISTDRWFAEGLAETYPFFLSLAFAAFVVGMSLPFFFFLQASVHGGPHG